MLSSRTFSYSIYFFCVFQAVLSSTLPWAMLNVERVGNTRTVYIRESQATDDTADALIQLVNAESLAERYKNTTSRNEIEFLFVNVGYFASGATAPTPATGKKGKKSSSTASLPTLSAFDTLSSDQVYNQIQTLYEDYTAVHFVKNLPGFIQLFCQRLYGQTPENYKLDSQYFDQIKAFKLYFSAGKVVIYSYLILNEADDPDYVNRMHFGSQLSSLFPSSVPALLEQCAIGWQAIINDLKTSAGGANVSSLLSGTSTSTNFNKNGKKSKATAAVAAPTPTPANQVSNEEQAAKLVAEFEKDEQRKQAEKEKKLKKQEEQRLKREEESNRIRAEKEAERQRKAEEEERKRKEQSNRDKMAYKQKQDEEKRKKDEDAAAKKQAAKQERERAEQERLERERAEQERFERERIAEQQRLEMERIAEEERLVKERIEKERIAEQKRIEKERAAAEQKLIEKERAAELARKRQQEEQMRFAAKKQQQEAEKARLAAAEALKKQKEQEAAEALKKQQEEAAAVAAAEALKKKKEQEEALQQERLRQLQIQEAEAQKARQAQLEQEQREREQNEAAVLAARLREMELQNKILNERLAEALRSAQNPSSTHSSPVHSISSVTSFEASPLNYKNSPGFNAGVSQSFAAPQHQMYPQNYVAHRQQGYPAPAPQTHNLGAPPGFDNFHINENPAFEDHSVYSGHLASAQHSQQQYFPGNYPMGSQYTQPQAQAYAAQQQQYSQYQTYDLHHQQYHQRYPQQQFPHPLPQQQQQQQLHFGLPASIAAPLTVNTDNLSYGSPVIAPPTSNNSQRSRAFSQVRSMSLGDDIFGSQFNSPALDLAGILGPSSSSISNLSPLSELYSNSDVFGSESSAPNSGPSRFGAIGSGRSFDESISESDDNHEAQRFLGDLGRDINKFN